MSFHGQIEPLSIGEGYYGVYLGANHTKPMDILVGMVVQDAAGAPEGVQVREVPAALYTVFECWFQEIGSTYSYIWDEWLQASAYRAAAIGGQPVIIMPSPAAARSAIG